jgi:hypothetical protein
MSRSVRLFGDAIIAVAITTPIQIGAHFLNNSRRRRRIVLRVRPLIAPDRQK